MGDFRSRAAELARRAGLGNVPPRTLAAGAAVCAIGLAAALWYWWPSGAPSPGLTVDSSYSSAGGSTALASSGKERTAVSHPETVEATATVFVHVVGAVPRPGLYRLPAGARVAEALAAAGGLLGSAEERAVNLARPVSDGEQIVVPTKDEVAQGIAPLPSLSPGNSAPGDGAAGARTPVDINSADVAALDSLPGIGPSTAAKIVADREANGPFVSAEDLGRVSGIGPKKLETLLGLIVAR